MFKQSSTMIRRGWAVVLAFVLGLVGVALVGTPSASAAVSSSAPVMGLARTPSGNGYWEVASDGGVFSFGDAGFYGSMGGRALNAPVVGLAVTPSGRGYWEVASDGGVFSFGDAPFKGSEGGRPLNRPVSGMAATPTGQGYFLVGSDGGVFTFGDAVFKGSAAQLNLKASANSIVVRPGGDGYWVGALDGGVFSYGSAPYLGRAAYAPPVSTGGSAGSKAANLATGWLGLTYTGINGDRWNAGAVEYWCADFQTYVWQHAGIPIPHTASVSSVRAWGVKNGRWSTDVRHPQLGDAVVYGSQHVGVVIEVRRDGWVVSADGDFGGTGDSQVAFAKSARVRSNVWNPTSGKGAGGMVISGYVRAS